MNAPQRLVDADRAGLQTAIGSVLDSGWLIHGSEHAAFELEFASYVGATQAIGVANGTDALAIALRAVGVEPGHQVMTVANAGFYTTTACLSIGAVPRFVDVERESLNVSPAAVREAIERVAPAAIVVTHLYGRLAEVEAIVGHSRAAGIPVVEDCAQATGARNAVGQMAGTFGDIGCFSFYPTKNLAGIGDGGAIVTSSPELADRCRRIRQYGWVERYSVAEIGYNSRLDEVQAAVLRFRLKHLDSRNARRREIASMYARALSADDSRLVFENDQSHVAHLAVARTTRRDEFREFLRSRGIATDIHYPITDDSQPIWQLGGRAFESEDLSETHAAVTEIVSVPCFPELSDAEVDRVETSLADFSDGRS
jgi:aminotransferase EvaB